MTHPAEWLDTSEYGFRLVLGVDAAESFLVLLPLDDCPDALTFHEKALVDLHFATSREFGDDHAMVRSSTDGHGRPWALVEMKKVFLGSKWVSFDPTTHRMAMPGSEASPGDPQETLERMAREIARFAREHGLDAEAAVQDAILAAPRP